MRRTLRAAEGSVLDIHGLLDDEMRLEIRSGSGSLAPFPWVAPGREQPCIVVPAARSRVYIHSSAVFAFCQ